MQYICNGANGMNGKDGQNGADGQDGQDCQNGHHALVATSNENAGTNCANVGIRIDSGIDTNNNNTLETSEILTTRYVCNGTNGADGQDGTNGTNGTNASIRTTAFDGEQGSCTNGGVKIEVLVDGVIQEEQTQYICNGADSIGECLTDNDCRETAYCDQTTYMCVDKKAAGDACTHGNQCLSESCWDNICCVIGDRIIFGNYEQDYDTTNGKEPIEWRVLDKNDKGQLFIISEKVLDVQSYNTTQVNITWEFSTIRSWLNGYAPSYNNVGTDFTSDNFIDAAFTAEEKVKIVTSNVIYNKSNATTDKVFLLSKDEVRNYFANDSDRLADATRYVVRKNAIVRGSESGVSYNGTCTDIHCYPYWWLRSKESNTTTAHGVMYDGTIRESIAINAKTIGVRPVLWVNSF